MSQFMMFFYLIDKFYSIIFLYNSFFFSYILISSNFFQKILVINFGSLRKRSTFAVPFEKIVFEKKINKRSRSLRNKLKQLKCSIREWEYFFMPRQFRIRL